MSKKLKTIIFYTITFGAALFLLYSAYMKIEAFDDNGERIPRWTFLMNTLRQGNMGLLLLSAVFAIIAHLIRAERWKLLLNPLGHKLTLKHGFLSVMIGYFVNLAIPRGGELSRSVAINRLNKNIPIDTSFGSIVAERVIDLIFLLLCIGVGFIIEWDKLTYFMEDFLAKNKTEGGGLSITMIILIAGAVMGIVGILLIKYNKTVNKIFKDKFLGFLLGMKEGFLSVFKLQKAWLFILYSFMIWFLYYLMTYTVLKAFPTTATDIDLLGALSIFAIGGVAMAIPMPGGTGSYQLLVSAGLVGLYNLGSSDANAFAIIFHGWQTIVVILVGAVSMIVTNRLAKTHQNEKSDIQNSKPAGSTANNTAVESK